MEPKQRILIVDDEESIVFSYKKLLGGARVEVDGCTCLDDALALLQVHSYNVVITDFRLSHSESNEGLAILQFIKEHSPATAVIFFTGYGSDEVQAQVLALGAYGYFNKPVQVAVIIDVLAKIGIAAGKD